MVTQKTTQKLADEHASRDKDNTLKKVPELLDESDTYFDKHFDEMMTSVLSDVPAKVRKGSSK
jgi:hypothetical protein